MASLPFKLSSTLFGHSSDVRAVAITKDNCIVSGSRDCTAKFWKPNGFNTGYTESITFKGHTSFVASVCVLEASKSFPNGLIITGGKDSRICFFTLDSPTPINTTQAHTDTVCCLSAGNDSETFLSSSWDLSAKLWSLQTPNVALTTFKGHSAAVWSVAQLNNGNIVTGGADKLIMMWSKDGTKLKTLSGHTDCVRGIAVINSDFFISVANDASVKQWTIGGDCVNTAYGHSNYIYCVAVDKSTNEFNYVTGGEDRTARYWQQAENTQIVTLPAQSVWAVGVLSNGDIVTGSSDGLVRIFTQDPGRVAEEPILKDFEQQVNNIIAASAQDIGGIKLTDLPGPESLFQPGNKDGQTKIVREGATPQLYQWSVAEGQWKKVGTVMGGAGGTQETSGKTLYEGVEYDYVFSVDVEEGKPALKLPYNCDEDPWTAAQKFIHKHNLPQVYLDQVANFIVTNSAGKKSTATATSASNSTVGQYMDPFTGASRYVPGSSDNPFGTAGSNADPFTGSSSYTTSHSTSTAPSHTSSQASLSSKQYFPHENYLKFEQSNLQGIRKTLMDFNSKAGDGNNINENLMDGVLQLGSDGLCDPVMLGTLLDLLKWPQECVYPVLDIIRLAVRYPEINEKICGTNYKVVIMSALKSYINNGCAVDQTKLCAVRILANMFSAPSGEALALENYEHFLSVIPMLGPNLSKHLQIAASTVILNYSIAFIKKKCMLDVANIVNAIAILVPRTTEYESQFRCLVAVGTLLCLADDDSKITLLNNLKTNPDFMKKLKNICNLVNVQNLEQEQNLYKTVACATQINDFLN